MQLVPQVFLTGSYPHSLGLLFLQPATSSYQNHAASQDSVTGRSINLARPTRSNRAVKIGLFLAGSCTTPLGATVSAARNFQLSKPRCWSVAWAASKSSVLVHQQTALKFLAGSYPHPLGITVSAARNFQLSKSSSAPQQYNKSRQFSFTTPSPWRRNH